MWCVDDGSHLLFNEANFWTIITYTPHNFGRCIKFIVPLLLPSLTITFFGLQKRAPPLSKLWIRPCYPTACSFMLYFLHSNAIKLIELRITFLAAQRLVLEVAQHQLVFISPIDTPPIYVSPLTGNNAGPILKNPDIVFDLDIKSCAVTTFFYCTGLGYHSTKVRAREYV